MSVQEDRRDVKSQRIPFDAIVELGDDDPGAAFEAQGVNLSANGMQLRTAYLPDVGQALLCRFGSGAQEIQAEADVVWRKEGARGGEFGIRFTNVDGASAAALWDLCGAPREDASGDSSNASRSDADEGTRVRLHIDGLTSPMKARVRGAVGKELLVGSNLEFLKVGRSLELENVDQGGKRPAHIDRVDVELDRDSRVPQLVVTLRYDDMSADPPPVMPFASQPPPYFPPSPSTSPPPAPALDPSCDLPTVVKTSVPSLPPPVPPPVSQEAPTIARAAVPSTNDDRTPEEIELARMMRSKVSIAAADTMVKVASLGVRAKAAFGEALAKALQRSTKGEAPAPRRKTSPPPGGALHASGKRVVREGAEGADAAVDGAEKTPKVSRKAMALVGGATGLVALSLVAMLARGGGAPPGAEKAADTAAAGTPAAAEAQPAETPANTSGAVEAKVPLFGPTMIATAETPATPAPAPVSASNAPMSPMIRTLAFGGASTFGEEPIDKKVDVDDGKVGKIHGKALPFGHGKVEHAMMLRIKTDGNIADLRGVRSSSGFTLTMPGRRTLDTGSALAARDPRIASVRVANNAKGSELTFQFKGGVPAYLVSPNGRDLQLALGRPDAARETKDVAHRSATAQKRVTEVPHRAAKR